MIFSDMGVNPTSWGYCVYDDVIAKLVAAGIPRGEIAAVGDADSDAKKQSLFERVRNGSVRVLIGRGMGSRPLSVDPDAGTAEVVTDPIPFAEWKMASVTSKRTS